MAFLDGIRKFWLLHAGDFVMQQNSQFRPQKVVEAAGVEATKPFATPSITRQTGAPPHVALEDLNPVSKLSSHELSGVMDNTLRPHQPHRSTATAERRPVLAEHRLGNMRDDWPRVNLAILRGRSVA
jgi:hypothetical protein